MAYTTINKSSDYFNTVTYTGNGLGTRAVTGVGFQPDLVWIKGRSVAEHHNLYDAIRGATKPIYTNLNYSEATVANSLKSFGGDGFTISDNSYIGQNNATYASWNWKANGSGSANTDGSISSTVSANTTSGFSIVSWTGTGSAGTIGHGLGKLPKMIIAKQRNTARNWVVYFLDTSIANNNVNNYLELDTTAASTGDSGGRWGSYANYSTTTFGVGTDNGTNQSGGTYIAYVFSDIKAFSKIGKYVGNGNADGSFIYTGFKPAFLMIKCTDAARSWQIHNSKSSLFNTGNTNARLFANLANAEAANSSLDLLSNGFKVRESSDLNTNGSGNNYIYMAFAEAPLVGTNNVPATAR